VPQIVNAHIGQADGGADAVPGFLQVDEALTRTVAADHVRVVRQAGDALQHSHRGGRQLDDLLTGLGVRQVQHAARQINVLPLQFEDFVAPCAGEHQQADSRDGVGPFRVVALGVGQRCAQPAELIDAQEALLLADRVFLDAACTNLTAGTERNNINDQRRPRQYLQSATLPWRLLSTTRLFVINAKRLLQAS